MKRIICLILALLLLVPAAYADEASDMVFHMESVTGEVGDTVTVMASVKNAPKCASFRIIFTYDDTVLQVVSGQKEKAAGLFMINTNTEHDGKAAVNALAADASKVLEGDMDLFSVKFKIIAETESDAGTLLEVVTEEFFTEDLKQIHPTIEQARISVSSDATGGNEGDPNPDNGTATPDNSGDNNTEGNPSSTPNGDTTGGNSSNTNGDTTGTTSGSTTGTTSGSTTGTTSGNTNGDSNATTSGGTSGSNQADTPASTTPETDNTKDKTPTGSWLVDEENEEVVHVQENGDYTTYVPEFTETPEVGKVTDVILKDEETGEEVGSIKVEKQEDGAIEVVEQDLLSAGEAKKSGVPGWVWVVIGVVAVAAAAAVVLVVVTRKKKAEAPAESSTDEE